jgi:hypothetical protein
MYLSTSTFLDKRIDWHLHAVEVRSDSTVWLRSENARIKSDPTGKLRLEVCGPAVTGESRSMGGLPKVMAVHGVVGTEEVHFEAESWGRTEQYCAASDQKHWDLHVARMRLHYKTSPSVLAEKKYLRGRVVLHLGRAPTLSLSSKYKRATINDDFFGGTSFGYQYLLFTIGEIEFAWRLDNGRCDLSILAPTDDSEELGRLRQAWEFAIALRYGQRIDTLAAHLVCTDADVVEFNPDVHVSPDYEGWSYPPLLIGPFDDGSNEKFFQKAISFFLRQERVRLEDYMLAFWDSGVADSLHVRESILGSVIEGLAESINSTTRKATGSFRQLRKRVVELIEADETCRQSPHLERLKAGVHDIKEITAKDFIEQAAKSIRLAFSPSELDAWRRMRNAAAHGSHIEKGMDSSRGKDFRTCVGMLNKFALAIIGYEGHYWDYSDDTDGASKFYLSQ